MNKLTHLILILIFTSFLYACSTSIEQYNKVDEPFDIKNYFNGNVIAWGIVQDFSGQVTQRFCVEIQGSWQETQGVLAEKFYFDDGKINYRNWHLTKQNNGSYLGKAEDTDGIAIGKHKGFAFQFNYNLLLPYNGDTYNVSMDDWMYQLDQYRVMNKTSISKFGIKVAEVTLFFDKELPHKNCIDNVSR
ncbi:DUF3833 domain-containing protein [Litorilituus lipolyticus]|uniref:DUF3833 domain-containing protein n=1 Tax=Litorilituus lipolyticus TaxID=2491017 RepID=A0A502KR80_9GAMM|nr:DUF3833 domain-containing protein [Litorilituus lipolyticus]TPH12093.1 DUF3833 domain-containing protein [Litorilituus lipolyticus]